MKVAVEHWNALSSDDRSNDFLTGKSVVAEEVVIPRCFELIVAGFLQTDDSEYLIQNWSIFSFRRISKAKVC
jgi:hypothetical protein